MNSSVTLPLRFKLTGDIKAVAGVLEDDNATELLNGAVLVGHTSGLER